MLGFRQFLLRGLENVRNKWRLVTMAWNIKRIFALTPELRVRSDQRLKPSFTQKK
jgi:hypothetical protein